jgi:hypothetical protein
MANPVREQGGSSLYLGKGTFDIVPISVALDLKLESYPVECRVEMSRGINEKQRVVDMVFLLQLSEEYPGECLIVISATVYRCDRTQSCGRYRNDSK